MPQRDASVRGTGALVVAADVQTVWDVLADFGRWPEWNPDVKEVVVKGSLVPGTEFRWKAGPSTITSIVQEVSPPRTLSWTGKTLGIRAEHLWRLEPIESGTRVSTEEEWWGIPVRFMRGWSERTLQKAISDVLPRLKTEAERRK